MSYADLADLFSRAGTDGDVTSIGRSVIAIVVALVLGAVISLTYIKSTKSRYSPSLIFTLIVLPAVVAAVIILIGNNLARAFSMAGVFSLIRYRSEPGDPKDIAYIFLSSAIGLAAGLGFLLYGVIFTLVICIAMLILSALKLTGTKQTHYSLKITVPEDLNFKDVFTDLLEKYTSSFNVTKVRTADLGTVYELTYDVVLVDGINEKEFIDELRVRNGNMNIILTLAELTK